MQFPENIYDNIFRYLPPVSYQDLVSYSHTNRRMYYAARRVFYGNLIITNNDNIPLLLDLIQSSDIKDLVVHISINNRSNNSLIPIVEEENSFIMLDFCRNIKSISLWNLNPFYILESMMQVELPELERIDVDWRTCNGSSAVKKLFFQGQFIARQYYKLSCNAPK